MNLAPADRRNERVQLRCWMATGQFAAIDDYLHRHIARAEEQPLRKARRYYREYKQLQKTAPMVVAAWRAALDNTGPGAALGAPHSEATLIQDLSQGTPPDDVQLVISEWKALLERERIGKVELFDQTSARAWIDEQAPEFSQLFAGAFHYAMESDIFRIAYASKRPCIYVDADGWPLDHAAEILKFAVQSQRTMLYFRAQRPWIANGFFVSAANCPFFTELVTQSLRLNLDDWVVGRATIGKTFGPARYNKVLTDIIKQSDTPTVTLVEEVPGCSRISMKSGEIYFSHEAAIAAVKPPYLLAYTATDEYWKRIASK
jgi:hypothetical protein